MCRRPRPRRTRRWQRWRCRCRCAPVSAQPLSACLAGDLDQRFDRHAHFQQPGMCPLHPARTCRPPREQALQGAPPSLLSLPKSLPRRTAVPPPFFPPPSPPFPFLSFPYLKPTFPSPPFPFFPLQEDGLYLLMQELQRGLEEPGRRRGAATVVALFCKSSKLDFQEHVPSLIGVRALGLRLRRACSCAAAPHGACCSGMRIHYRALAFCCAPARHGSCQCCAPPRPVDAAQGCKLSPDDARKQGPASQGATDLRSGRSGTERRDCVLCEWSPNVALMHPPLMPCPPPPREPTTSHPHHNPTPTHPPTTQ